MRLEVINICKSYGSNHVFSDFSCVFEDKTVTAVMGASGCGKTTLINMLMGIVAPESGRIIPSEGYKKSAVFQENRLCDNLTVSANIRLVTGKKFSKEEINNYLRLVGLLDCSSQKVKELSGGMKRRVALLRAVLADYDVLFMDEPFKGLDDSTKYTVMRFCQKMFEDKTVIMVTHDKSECDFLADKILDLNDKK